MISTVTAVPQNTPRVFVGFATLTVQGVQARRARTLPLRPELAFLDVAVSGASAGYFLAWMIRFASVYRRSVSPDLAAEAPS